MKTNQKDLKILETALKDRKLSAKDILDMVKKNATTKFDESIDGLLK